VTTVLISYLPLLLLTLAAECAVLACLAPREQRRRALEVCVGLNLVTHPLVTLLSWRLGVDMLALELSAFLFEWWGYATLLRIRSITALRYALLTNVCSAVNGIVIWTAFWS